MGSALIPSLKMTEKEKKREKDREKRDHTKERVAIKAKLKNFNWPSFIVVSYK